MTKCTYTVGLHVLYTWFSGTLHVFKIRNRFIISLHRKIIILLNENLIYNNVSLGVDPERI